MIQSKILRTVILLVTIGWTVVYSIYGWRELCSVLIGHKSIRRSVSFTDLSAPEWFMLHPLLAILGTVALPVPGIILRKYKGYWSKKIHALFMTVSSLAVFLSVYVVFVNRSVREKPHLASTHAWYGATIFAGYILFTLSGFYGLDPDWASVKDEKLKKTIKWIHKSGGRIFAVIGYWVCLTGWQKLFHRDEAKMRLAFVVVITASVLTILDPIVGLFNRMKAKNE
jgi:hypothetical protein